MIIFPLFNTTLHDGSPHPPGHMMDRPNTHCDTSQQIISANTHTQALLYHGFADFSNTKHARQFCAHDALSLRCRWMWQVGVTLVKKHVEQSPVFVFFTQQKKQQGFFLRKKALPYHRRVAFLPFAPKIFFKMSTFAVSTSNFG